MTMLSLRSNSYQLGIILTAAMLLSTVSPVEDKISIYPKLLSLEISLLIWESILEQETLELDYR